MSIAVGIDLGTTNSAISYIKDGNVQMIPIEGKNTFPSVIAVRNGEILWLMENPKLKTNQNV